jgi:hypothetical protein
MSEWDGRVQLAHTGRTVTLQFTWAVIADLQTAWGPDAYAKRIADALDNRIVPDLAELVARSGGLSADDVMAWSPPLVETATALQEAYAAAWLGPKRLRQVREAAGEEGANPRRQTLLMLLSRLRSGRGFGGATSGH